MAAITARYWRFNVTAVDGGTYASAAEFQFYGTSDGTGTNLSLSGTASQTGDGSVGAASAGKDGSTGSEAGSSFTAPGPYRWTIDLGSPQAVQSCALIAQRVLPNRTPKDFSVQYSTDNTNWTNLATFTSQTGWVEYERRVFALIAAVVEGTVTGSDNNPAARTIRVYRRDTGALLGEVVSDGVTGEYSLTVAYSGEVQVIALDDGSGTLENDLIHRAYPV